MSHDQPGSNPYRKVSTATWTDRKVLNLTPLKPSGQALFLMLMVGPQTTNIPGVQPVGRMAFAEMLGWEPEAFDEAFAEAYREGLAKADWKARLVYVPNALKHNLPQSPNVVKSWSSMWARIPECDLKGEIWRALHNALETLGPAFVGAFKSACPLKNFDDSTGDDGGSPKPSDKAFPKASPKPTDNQEAVSSKQETGEKTPPNPPPGGRVRAASSDELPDGFAAMWESYPRKDAKQDAVKAWRQLHLDTDSARREQAMAGLAAWRRNEGWTRDGKWRMEFIPLPASWIRGERWNDAAIKAGPGDGEAGGEWWQAAGFPNRFEAENARCFAHTAHAFRDGKRLPVDEEVTA